MTRSEDAKTSSPAPVNGRVVSQLSVAIRSCAWMDGLLASPIKEDLVPGASVAERKRLAGLGGIARCLSGIGGDWPGAVCAWVLDAPDPPDDLMDAVYRSLDRGEDPLAAIYERAVAARHRRELGTFFTPDVLVEHMLARAEIIAGGPPDLVVDPGAGVGAFTVAAARRWPKAEVVAVDVNVVTLGLLAARVRYEELESRVRLVHGDFVGWLQSHRPEAESRLLYIGNPPYTRSQSLTTAAKTSALEAAEGLIVSGHANLSTLFTAVIFQQLRDQDAACLLLPAAWTHTRSARELREELWLSRQRPLELHRWPTDSRAFRGPSVTATVLGIGAERDRAQPFRHSVARIVAGDVRLSNHRQQSRGNPPPHPWPGGTGRRMTAPPANSVPLGEVLRPRRGLATGANRFFFVDDAVARLLPEEVQRPGLLSLSGLEIADHRLDQASWDALRAVGTRCVLLDIAPDQAKVPAVDAYLRTGRAEGLDRRVLCQRREPWFNLERIEPPDLILAPLSAREMRVVTNPVRAIPSNSLYGLYRVKGVSNETIERVASWLRSADGFAAIAGHAHRMPGGSLKLEPGDVRTLPIPAGILGASRPEEQTTLVLS